MTWTDGAARRALRAMFEASIAAVDPSIVLARHLPDKPRGRCVVVGAGKAAASMAAAVEAAWPDVALSGLVVTRYGHTPPGSGGGRIGVVEAAHPVPDEAGVSAAGRILSLVRGLEPEDLVLALVSGGGSALLSLPAPGLSLADKQAISRALLSSGMPIGEMNVVRRALSAIKGGRLARAAAPARVVSLLISDIPGDDPASIASGPTIAPSRVETRADASALLRRYGITPGGAVEAFLARPDPEPGLEPVPGPATATDDRLIASPQIALLAAAETARRLGLATMILGDAIEGESRELGRVLAGIARSVRRHGHPLAGPCVLLSGGETVVTMPHGGSIATMGGRNTELMLAMAVALQGDPSGIWALAGDTDGIDGNQDVAGAVIGPDTLSRAGEAGLDATALLARHESYAMFAALGDLVHTGPTFTNVNDFRAILVS